MLCFACTCITLKEPLMTRPAARRLKIQCWSPEPLPTQWLCSHENESRSERRFGTWFGPFLIWKPDFSPCECNTVSNQAFETRFETRKKGVLDRDPRRKPDSRTCKRKALSERDSCMCILEMCAEAMHGSISADCAVGTKYYLAVRRSWSWLGRCLQCMWTHVVQITIPIMFRNVFRNVIRSHVNTATISPNAKRMTGWVQWTSEQGFGARRTINGRDPKWVGDISTTHSSFPPHTHYHIRGERNNCG